MRLSIYSRILSGARDDCGSVYELASGVFIWEEKERSIMGLLNHKEVCRLIRGLCTLIGRHKDSVRLVLVGVGSAPFARVHSLSTWREAAVIVAWEMKFL